MDRDRKRTAWHRAAFARHITRVPDDFPDPRSSGWWVFFDSWSESLDELRVGEAEFEAASKRVSRDPPSHPNKHLKALVEAIEHARRTGASVPNDREQAERESRNCPYCGGGGLASRDHEHPQRGGYSLTYICICPLGRWLKGQHDRDPKAPKLRDLAHFPELQYREDDFETRHMEIGRYFAERARARTEGRPMPPKPESIRAMDERDRRRRAYRPDRRLPKPLFREDPDPQPPTGGTAP